MATGTITTARGESLNMDDLIMRSSAPLKKATEASTRATPNYQPRPNQNPVVRGFVPSSGSTGIVSAYAEDGEAESLADMTGIKMVRKPGAKKPKVAATEETAEIAPVPEDESLGDLMKEIKTK